MRAEGCRRWFGSGRRVEGEGVKHEEEIIKEAFEVVQRLNLAGSPAGGTRRCSDG